MATVGCKGWPLRASGWVTTATRIGGGTGGPSRGAPNPPRIARVAHRHRRQRGSDVADERASGPCTEKICADSDRSLPALGLNAGTRPNDGRSPASPHAYAG